MQTPKINPYLDTIYAPVRDELTIDELEVIGELPEDLTGMYVRNSPNPRFEPPGRYHWFDGDGMLHGVAFQGGKATYRNRYVQTRAFQVEDERGEAVWGGILDPAQMGLPGGPIKNTSNTDLVWHNGRLLSLWWLASEPYEIAIPSLTTVGPCDFDGQLSCGVSAHPKVDPRTGELVFMDFSVFKKPYMRYGVLSADGTLSHMTPIELPAPRIAHDLAITENYTILLDLPLGWDLDLMRRGKRRITFDRETPARFGIIPRHGDASELRWFEAAPCYIYHTINAWEEGDTIVLTGCRVENPMPTGDDWDGTIPRLYFLELQPFMHRWTFNLKTGEIKEERLDDIPSEFPRMNDDLLGSPSRYSYNPRIAPKETLLFDGLIKYDTDTNNSVQLSYGPDRFGSEAVFVPRPGGEGEDDGWIVTLLYDVADDSSECAVYDAQGFSDEPIARVLLPRRVPAGFHACWVDDLNPRA